MDIHFISTLTPEDEDRLAPMVVGTIRAILEVMPISYAVRVHTPNGRVFEHTSTEETKELDRRNPHPFASRRVAVS